MSNSKMLIDATHPEETRVVVQRNGRVEEFDFESAARKLLRGNIYLAKVTRVEPSLQAAFVDYGGNRHGFLAFNEIHPDYYQIPVADRQALIDEEAAAEAELEAAADRRAEALERRSRQRGHSGAPRSQAETDTGATAAAPSPESDDEDGETGEEISNIVDVEEDEHIEEIGGENGDDEAPRTFAAAVARDETVSEASPVEDVRADHDHSEAVDADEDDEQHEGEAQSEDDHEEPASDGHEQSSDPAGYSDSASEAVETANRSDMLEEVAIRPRRRPRSYKIQEVIKRRQVILVQVVKEERGNKGAALTTYLSLAGRYTVLMPNTARGGGISRKITNPQDRKRLKAIAQELDVPEGMGLIIRTAGAARTKQEIKRDFEYLLRLWESVRDLTLQSTAPSLVYEEGDLIKRSIRDLYNKDVEEVVVAGDGGYREAADFMHMLLPSHSKNVIQYSDATPLFARYGVERQLNAMFSPQVTLRSGGYIVINQTEALVAIDVNSGKSTREFSIEETALATNLEAADEIARQLKLRDLAGLIVIDFIDMEEKRNNRAVERRLKDALRHDRARIQLGRISHFGLMEMSRQRLRTGVLEGSTSQCQHCQGTGIIRSTESVALAVLRGLEDAITAGASAPLIATTTPAVALYILNSKRAYISDMETRHGHQVTVLGSDRIHGANFTIERGQALAQPARRPERAAVNMDWGFEGEGDDAAPGFEGGQVEEVAEDAIETGGAVGRERQGGRGERSDRGERSERGERGERGEREGVREAGRDGDDDAQRRGRRRRRRRGGRRGERGDESQRGGDQGSEQIEAAGGENEQAQFGDDASNNGPGDDGDDVETFEAGREAGNQEDAGERNKRRRRRGRRGGRRGRERDGSGEQGELVGQGPNGASEGDRASQREDGEAPAGFEQQPEVDFQAERGHEPAIGRPQRTRAPDPERRRHGERIWDTPVATPDAPSAPVEPAPMHKAEPQLADVPVSAPLQEPKNNAGNGGKSVAERRRHETGSSEPRIERVVVRPDQAAPEAEGDASGTPPPPQRKGWWQRNFGGE